MAFQLPSKPMPNCVCLSIKVSPDKDLLFFSVDQSLKILALTGDGIERVDKSLAK